MGNFSPAFQEEAPCVLKDGTASEIKPVVLKTDSNKKVVISGLEDFIIIDTEDALMVCPMDKNQEIKDISVNALRKFNQKED